jgi:hypothetical protein
MRSDLPCSNIKNPIVVKALNSEFKLPLTKKLINKLERLEDLCSAIFETLN